MRLTQYFTSPHTAQALDRYKSVVPPTWSVEHRFDLYRSAKIAFDMDVPEAVKQEAFRHIYDNLRSGWQVFRPKSGEECWSSDQIYVVLTNECQFCSRQSGLTLAALTEQDSLTSIEQCLASLGRMKPTERYPVIYPWMAVSKFLHFFNPHLFPIYDAAFMWEKVVNGVFKPDYLDFCRRRGFHPREDTKRFNLQYTLWAAETIQNVDVECMTTFSEWFTAQIKEQPVAEGVLADVETYYAAAFEMIAIGAAHL